MDLKKRIIKALREETGKHVVMSSEKYKEIGDELDDETIVKIVDEDGPAPVRRKIAKTDIPDGPAPVRRKIAKTDIPDGPTPVRRKIAKTDIPEGIRARMKKKDLVEHILKHKK